MHNKIINSYIKKLNDIITESTNTKKYRDRTLQVIRDHMPRYADYEYIGNTPNPDKLTIAEYMEKEFRNEYFHGNVHQTVMRLEPIMMKIALDLGYSSDKMDSDKLNRLREIIHYITAKINESKRTGVKLDFDISKMTENNTSFENLDETFGKIIDEINNKENELIDSIKFSGEMNPDYKILPDIDYETAKLYGEHSCRLSTLCYIENETTWNAYTNSGRNTAYLILNKNWKNIPEKHGPDTPYDEYGLSMIFLFINRNGNIAYSNTRWNHETGDNFNTEIDHSFTKEQISKLLNVNFNKVFRHIDSWNTEVDKQMKAYLATGMSDIEEAYKFENGRILLKYKDAYNVLSEDNKLLTGFNWFNMHLDNGFFRPNMIYFDDKCNYLTKEGELLYKKSIEEWFDDGIPFLSYKDIDYAEVSIDEKWNYIISDGKFLFDKWFDRISDFRSGYAICSDGDDYDADEWIVNINGEVIFSGLEEVIQTSIDSLFKIRKGGKFNIFNRLTGNLFFKDYVDNIDSVFYQDFATFWNRDKDEDIKYNYVSRRGDILYKRPIDDWFDACYPFKYNFGRVQKDKKYNFIDKDGNLLYDKPVDDWFDFAKDFGSAGTVAADVEIKGKKYVILNSGEVYPYKNKEN